MIGRRGACFTSTKAKGNRKRPRSPDPDPEESPGSPDSARGSSEKKKALSISEVVRRADTFGSLADASERITKDADKLLWKQLETVIINCGNAKYFDGELFEKLTGRFHREITGSSESKELSPERAVELYQVFLDLNALSRSAKEDSRRYFFERKKDLSIKYLEVLTEIFGADFLPVTAQSSNKVVCPAFWRGQCKWGSRCKFSHEEDKFETAADRGRWKPPSGASVGMQQSMSMRADKTGALW